MVVWTKELAMPLYQDTTTTLTKKHVSSLNIQEVEETTTILSPWKAARGFVLKVSVKMFDNQLKKKKDITDELVVCLWIITALIN